MKIKYTGPSVRVEVDPPASYGVAPFTVDRDTPIEVKTDLGQALCQQETWEAVEAPAKTKKEA